MVTPSGGTGSVVTESTETAGCPLIPLIGVTSVTSVTAATNGSAPAEHAADWQTFRESLFARARLRGFPEVPVDKWTVAGEEQWRRFCFSPNTTFEHLRLAEAALDALVQEAAARRLVGGDAL